MSYLSGVKNLHSFLGYNTDAFRGIALRLTLQGLRRLNKHVPCRAKPITPALLKAIYYELDFSKPFDLVFWLICIMAFFLLFRKSNLVPDTMRGFDVEKQLKTGDCISEDNRLVVGIRWAKNHQFSRELLTFPLPKLGNSVLCPIKAYRNVMQLFNHAPESHLFSLPDGNSITYRQFQNRLQEVVKSLGEPNYKLYRTHSFRRGGTTFSFLCGVPIEVIKLMGNWKSNAFMVYLEFPLEMRSAACELVKMRIKAMEDANVL